MTPEQLKANNRQLAIATVGSVAEIVLAVVFLVAGGTEPGILFLVLAALQLTMVGLALRLRRHRGVTGSA